MGPCARESKEQTGRFLREKLTSVCFLPTTRADKERRTGKIRGAFQGCTGLWTAVCWLALRFHQLKASTTMDLGTSILPIYV